MKLNLYAVYDQKTRAFDAPFTAQNEATALRTFQRVRTNIPLMKDNPNDFDLYEIGSYHTTTGRVDPSDVVQKINNPLDSGKTPEKANGQIQQPIAQERDDPPVQSGS